MTSIRFHAVSEDGLFRAPLSGLIKLARNLDLNKEICLEMMDQIAKLMAADGLDEANAKEIFTAGFRVYLEYGRVVAAMRKVENGGTDSRPPNAADDWVNELLTKIQKESKDAPGKES